MAERLEERRFRALRPEAWTTVGDAVAVELRELGIDEPMADISNGADLVRFHPKHRGAARRRLQLATDDRLVVCIGRLESVKGHESLLRAWSVHKAAGGRGRLAIIGSGTMHQRIADLLARTPIPDAALLGRLSDADKDAHLHAADLVAVPSLYEGQPLAALEALAAGVPVLGNRIPHLAFVARAGAGAVTDFADPAAAAAALAGWLGNAKRWERASHDGRAYAEREFDWDRITARYEERLAAVASAR
jgi:glycosyltransferase involved in cell wall biosynthesis